MHQALGIMEATKSEGMITMDRALRDMVEDGSITEEVALRFVRSPQSLQTRPSTTSPPTGTPHRRY